MGADIVACEDSKEIKTVHCYTSMSFHKYIFLSSPKAVVAVAPVVVEVATVVAVADVVAILGVSSSLDLLTHAVSAWSQWWQNSKAAVRQHHTTKRLSRNVHFTPLLCNLRFFADARLKFSGFSANFVVVVFLQFLCPKQPSSGETEINKDFV